MTEEIKNEKYQKKSIVTLFNNVYDFLFPPCCVNSLMCETRLSAQTVTHQRRNTGRNDENLYNVIAQHYMLFFAAIFAFLRKNPLGFAGGGCLGKSRRMRRR